MGAAALGQAGYQSILVDLRAQGQSSGKYVTYGALESRDLVQPVAALRKAGLIRGRLGLPGGSMGAATVLLAAPRIPRLAAVVAISPYGQASAVIPRYARRAYWYARLIPSGSWRAAERKTGRIAGVKRAAGDPINAVSSIHAPLLDLQGGRDPVVSSAQARRLAARTPDSRLLTFPALGHLQLSEDLSTSRAAGHRLVQPLPGEGSAAGNPPPQGPPPANQIAFVVAGCIYYRVGSREHRQPQAVPQLPAGTAAPSGPQRRATALHCTEARSPHGAHQRFTELVARMGPIG